jgi:hypothetical protein
MLPSFIQFCYLFFAYHVVRSIFRWFKQTPLPPSWLIEELDGEYPLCLRVSGFHLMFMGFNNLYYRTRETRNGAPVYHMPSYLLYCLILIRPVNIYKDEFGFWRFEYGDCLQNIKFINGYQGHTPIGTFEYTHNRRKILVNGPQVVFE